ncbi:hypothetical protein DMH18_26310 [Streptomyces sp. WAC 06783]|uniref:hypothetical protein n=1 Tax=Streptomyces sp. WAC 06783 TaxID=2203211 RepID=UPI000F7478CC|nr:hypothetical protein [Streptomyces sp. WAC 06783]RSO06962.1 hypothetical protein DMH18_26310 [Streptomyces sp. WAC 06783]
MPSSAAPVEQLRGWHRCYTAVHRRGARALADLRDRYGGLFDTAAARQAVAERNRDAAQDFTNHLLPHAESLLTQAHTALAALPPARHHSAWKLLLDDLDHATSHSRRILSAQPETTARNAALWPYITTWAEHTPVVRDLIDQHHRPAASPSLPVEEQRYWTDLVQAAQGRGTFDAFETWYDTTGQQITLAHLDGEDATVLALAGDLSNAQLHVLGHYPDQHTAARSLPPPVPPGVLRPDVSPYSERVLSPEVPVQDLTRDVLEARQTGDVADLLLSATNGTGPAGVLARLEEFVSTCAEFGDALDTRDGQHFAARLHDLAAQVSQLTGELRAVGEDMAATVGVLPPYRTARPRHLPSAPPPPALSAQRPAEQCPTTAPTGIAPRSAASPRR